MNKRLPDFVGYIARDPDTSTIGGDLRDVASGRTIELHLIKRPHGYEVRGYLLRVETTQLAPEGVDHGQ